MPEIVLHFAPEGAGDPREAAERLAAASGALPDVASASAGVDASRSAVVDVMLAVSLATTALNGGADALVALRRVIAAAKDLAREAGLGGARIEVGLRQVDVDALTDAQAAAALAGDSIS